MHKNLSGEEFIDVEVESVLPVSKKVGVIGEEEYPGLIVDVITNLPVHIELRIATEVAYCLLVGIDIKLCMINLVSDAGLQIVGEGRYGSGELNIRFLVGI